LAGLNPEGIWMDAFEQLVAENGWTVTAYVCRLYERVR